MSTSRVNKYEKRRKNTKLLSTFIIVGSILVIVLIALLIFGGSDEAGKSGDNQTNQSSSQEEASNSNSESEGESGSADGSDESGTNNDSDMDEENNGETETEQVEPSDDNVAEAYTGDWEPVGTEQSEPHTINYNEGSQDRNEMRQAVAEATGLDVNNLTMWWIERNGDEKVINTVSDPDETEIYRVYNQWIPNEGWQPTKVEELKENDQKWRFE
ncbi:DUF1510 family protein [Lentibacillus jeotgali]|uniref:DUF1510 family protein n=1 Tax=Lentibacillus jeotgali TaxID=558169 RepID=UPI0002626854|nr:DUF1510 family protein [Lentibacillus jeotgali]